MARTLKLFSAANAPALKTAVDAYLAGLASTQLVLWLDWQLQDKQRYTGYEYTCTLVTDTGGGTLANKFTIDVYTGSTLALLQQTIDAAILAAPTELFVPISTVRLPSPSNLVQYQTLVLRNADAGAIGNTAYGPEFHAATSITDADSPYDASPGETVVCDATLGVITVNLPAAAAYGNNTVTVVKSDASANAITLQCDGAETINGANTDTLAAQYNAITSISDGTELFIQAEQ